MNIAILGYGVEGKSADVYFTKNHHHVTIFDHFTRTDLEVLDLSSFDMVMRSPSIPPLDPTWSSMTKYFFDLCPCPIIGVTGTKGKGTTCTIIKSILESLGQRVHLVGNIGSPALDSLDDIQPTDVVVYELSSFQLWDLTVSPHIGVVLHIEPDHLNVHADFSDYISAKSHLVSFQSPSDYTIFCQKNPTTVSIAKKSSGKKLPYPLDAPSETLSSLLDSLSLAGTHNRENCEAALLACAAFYNLPLDDFISKNQRNLKITLKNIKSLPHRLEFLRTTDGVDIYDDNFSTNIASLTVALAAFTDRPVSLILGGRDKTDNADLKDIKKILDSHQNLTDIILIGESGHELARRYTDPRFIVKESLKSAVDTAFISAKKSANNSQKNPVLLMSPAAASFDMFENVYARGAQFQKLVKSL